MLDGNAAGGELSEVFATDVTAGMCTCASCGATAALAAARAYMGGPGTVLRCSSCGSVLLRLVHARERLMLDTAGVRLLEL